jgi:hypothetical protein
MSMALTINPAGSGTRIAWRVDVLAFFVGVALGAMVSIGAMIAVVGTLILLFGDNSIVLMAIPLGLLVGLRELGIKVPVPYRRRQVREDWRSDLSTRSVAFAYGGVLGFGFATPFVSAAHAMTIFASPLLSSGWMMLLVACTLAIGKVIGLQVGAGTSSHGEVLDRILQKETGNRAGSWARRSIGLAATVMTILALFGSKGPP